MAAASLEQHFRPTSKGPRVRALNCLRAVLSWLRGRREETAGAQRAVAPFGKAGGAMNRGWGHGAGGEGDALARPIFEWTLEGGEERLESRTAEFDAEAGSARDEIGVLCDPVYAFRGVEPPSEGPAFLLRPARIGGEPAVLVVCWRPAEAGGRAEARAYAPRDVIEAGAQFFARIPAEFGNLVPVQDPSDADRAAGRAALAALMTPASDAEAPGLGASDAAAFWRRIAAVAERTPPALLPFFSAVWGEPSAERRADAAEGGRRRERDGFAAVFASWAPAPAPSSVGAQTKAALATLAAASKAAPSAADVEAALAAWPDEPRDASAHLIAALHSAAAPSVAAATTAFLRDPDASPPEPANDPDQRAWQLTRAAAAAEDAAAGRPDGVRAQEDAPPEPLDPVGCARAIGLLAIEVEPESAAAWSAFAARSPSRGYWSAVAIADPGLGDLGLKSLRDLAQIFALEHKARAALPEDAPTPLDGSRFKRLALSFLTNGGAVWLSAYPDFLLDPSGQKPAPGLKRAATIWAGVDVKAKRALGRTLDAIEAAAKTAPDGRAWAQALRLMRASTKLGDQDERAREAMRGNDATGLDFGRRLAQAIDAQSWRGAVFWRRALIAWREERLEDAPLDGASLRNAMTQKLQAESASSASVLRLLGVAPRPQPAAGRRGEPASEEPHHRSLGKMAEALRAVTARSPEPAAQSAPAPEPEQPGADPASTAIREPVEGSDKARAPVSAPPSATAVEEAEPVETPSPPGDAFETAARAANRWRARYRKALIEREKDGDVAPISFSAPGEEEADLDALEAIAAIATSAEGRRNPETLDAAIGEDLGWTARQLIGMRDEWRTRVPHEPAPEMIRAAWRTIAYSEHYADLQSEELFFLFFASKLLQRVERDGREPDPFAEPFLKLLEDQATPLYLGGRARVAVPRYKGWLGDYIWRARRKETEADLERLEDAAVQARLDRAMLFLALVTCKPEDQRVEPAAELWDPIYRDARGQAETIDAPLDFRARIERFFAAEGAAYSDADLSMMRAYAHAFEKIATRNSLWMYTVGRLSGFVVRMKRK